MRQSDNLIHRAIKYRLFPTIKQERKLNRYLHVSRYAFNFILKLQTGYFKLASAGLIPWNRSRIFYTEATSLPVINAFRKCYHWVRSAPSEIIRDGFNRACEAYTQKSKGAGSPNRKGYQDNDSFSYSANKQIFMLGTKRFITVPGIKKVELKVHQELPRHAKVTTVTVSRDGDQWFASFSFTLGDIPTPYTPLRPISWDEGLNSMVTLSTGDKITSPKALKKATTSLKMKQRQVSKSQKGSKRRKKKVKQLTKKHKKVRRIREYHGKFVAAKMTDMVKSNRGCLISQDVNIVGCMQNHKLAGTFADVGIGQLKIWLAQQCQKKGIPMDSIPRFSKTSGVCPLCRKGTPLLLSDRTFACCGIKHERDQASSQVMDLIWTEKQTPDGPAGEGRAGHRRMPRPLVRLQANRRLGIGHRAPCEAFRAPVEPGTLSRNSPRCSNTGGLP